jgi:hypothetical protein
MTSVFLLKNKKNIKDVMLNAIASTKISYKETLPAK